MILSESLRKHIDVWVAKYPSDQKQSAILPALRFAQEEHQGWLSKELIEAVAAYLEMPAIAAFEVATFYSMYELNPVGKHKISLCTNIACMLRGSEDIVAHLENKLAIKLGETTADGKITLREVECLGSCGTAPVCHIGHRYYENLTPEKMDEILEELVK